MTGQYDQIQQLTDRVEITELVARAAHWLDSPRWDGAERLFTDDVTAQTPGGEADGPQALAERARAAHADYERTLHAPSTVVVELDGDTAEVESVANVAFTGTDGTVEHLTARYRHEARRTAEGWRFCRMEIFPGTRTRPIEQHR